MSATIAWAKRTALEAYLTVCGRESLAIRNADREGQSRCAPEDDRVHLQAAIQWICRAQDVGDDDGVPAMFSFVEGWIGSYPETTGYIIPTFYDAAAILNNDELRQRANRMAEWLLIQQLPDGAYPALFVGSLGPPRVFNTGQAIFGLLRAARETREDKYLHAAKRAGDWLLDSQDHDGGWQRNTLGWIPHTYNVRTAWALIQLAIDSGDDRYRRAALANADWAVAQQCETGWFRNNDFVADSDTANLHTICYAMRGLLEIGTAMQCPRYLDSALRTARALHEIWIDDRAMVGKFDQNWDSAAEWRCLPGECQLALNWLRLDQVTGRPHFREAAVELLETTKAAQFLDQEQPDWFGGISGSLPIDGDYERYCLVNWGSKFLIDALLMKGRTDGAYPTG